MLKLWKYSDGYELKNVRLHIRFNSVLKRQFFVLIVLHYILFKIFLTNEIHSLFHSEAR